MALWRIATVKAELGHRSHTSIRMQVRAGLLSKPIPIGPRSVGWPDYEVRSIMAARIAGKNDDEIRKLVSDLHAKRVDCTAEALA